MRDVVLGMHNEERESLGLSPLAWDSALAADAARYARQMAQTNIFRHSARASRAVPSGENLWMGSRGLYDYEVMVGSFLDEKRLFRRSGKLRSAERRVGKECVSTCRVWWSTDC